jgi:hypothetical protein
MLVEPYLPNYCATGHLYGVHVAAEKLNMLSESPPNAEERDKYLAVRYTVTAVRHPTDKQFSTAQQYTK